MALSIPNRRPPLVGGGVLPPSPFQQGHGGLPGGNIPGVGANPFSSMPDFGSPSTGGNGWQDRLWDLAKGVPWGDILGLTVGAASAKGGIDAMNRANALRERAMTFAEGDYRDRSQFRTAAAEGLLNKKRPDLSHLTAGYTSPYKKVPSVGGGGPVAGAEPIPGGGLINHGGELAPSGPPASQPAPPPEPEFSMPTDPRVIEVRKLFQKFNGPRIPAIGGR